MSKLYMVRAKGHDDIFELSDYRTGKIDGSRLPRIYKRVSFALKGARYRFGEYGGGDVVEVTINVGKIVGEYVVDKDCQKEVYEC